MTSSKQYRRSYRFTGLISPVSIIHYGDILTLYHNEREQKYFLNIHRGFVIIPYYFNIIFIIVR